MTILTAAQNAIAKLVGRRPSAVVSSTDEICVEVTAIAQEAAVDIAGSYDWQNLTEFHTITANGADSAYPLPSDYGRMVETSEVFDPNNWCWGYAHVTRPSEWLFYQNNSLGLIPPGVWTIRKNQLHFLPTPPAASSAVFPYISKNIFTAENGSPKSAITQDSDSFILDERILTLAIVWRWLSLKRMDYQQEIEDYNIALDRATAWDRGARSIHRENGPRPFRGVQTAYPWPLGS